MTGRLPMKIRKHPYLPIKLSEEGDVFVAGVWLHRPDVISVQGHVIKVKALMKEVFHAK
jgi:hypothetical protein